MNTEEIKNSLHRLQTLVGGWHEDEVPAVERDLALEELRRIYAELRFGSAEVAEHEPAEAEDDAEPEVEVEFIMPEEETETDAEHETESAPEIETASEAEPQSAPQSAPQSKEPEQPQSAPATEPATEPVTEQQPQSASASASEPVSDRLPEQQPVQDVAAPQNGALFDDKDMLVPRHTRRSVIMSLYGDNGQPQAKVEQESTQQPASASQQSAGQPVQTAGKVLGDVLRSADKTLGDTIARPRDIAESAPVTSLRSAIGIADRFLLIRDLFGGDERAYERAIVAIDSFDNLDDCMVHIVENYSWRSESEGARLIMDLLQRKFRK